MKFHKREITWLIIPGNMTIQDEIITFHYRKTNVHMHCIIVFCSKSEVRKIHKQYFSQVEWKINLIFTQSCISCQDMDKS